LFEQIRVHAEAGKFQTDEFKCDVLNTKIKLFTLYSVTCYSDGEKCVSVNREHLGKE
jgi:hypothetical protein